MKDNSEEVAVKQSGELFDQRVNVTMTKAMRDEIARVANREGMPMTMVIRRLLLAGLGQHGGSWRVMGGVR